MLWVALGSASRTEFEAALGWSPGTLANLLYGVRGAGRVTATLLFDRHKIPLESWDQEPTEAFVPPAAREDEAEGAA